MTGTTIVATKKRAFTELRKVLDQMGSKAPDAALHERLDRWQWGLRMDKFGLIDWLSFCADDIMADYPPSEAAQ